MVDNKIGKRCIIILLTFLCLTIMINIEGNANEALFISSEEDENVIVNYIRRNSNELFKEYSKQYTGFYNGKAYHNGEILKNNIITLPKGTNIGTDSYVYATYDIISEEELKEIETLKQERDIYIIDEYGELGYNLAEDNNKDYILVGDVTLNGSVDIADVVRLNKYLLGQIRFSDAQKSAANCYDDNVIDALDSLALLKYVLGVEGSLPIDKGKKEQEDEFIEKMNDEFYNKFIKTTHNSFEFSEIAILIHKELRRAKEEGKIEYTEQEVEINNIYEKGNFGGKINATSYIGLCLYEYGIHTQNEELVNYITECQGEIYDITEDKLNKLGWQKIEYINKDQLENGDIIISETGAQIYLGDGVYSCESDETIRAINLLEPTEPGDGKNIIRIEPKSGENENLKWNLDEGILEVEVNGESDKNIIPWKASIKNISTYKVNASVENIAYIDTSIMVAGSSKNKTVSISGTFVGKSIGQIVDKVRKGISYQGYFVETNSIENVTGGYKVTVTAKLEEFYKDFINDSNAGTFYDISKIVKEKIQENSGDGGMTYNSGEGICIPKGIYSNGEFGAYADCSSYVCMCLYEYGIHTGNKELVKFIYNYRTAAGGTDERSGRTDYSKPIL